MTTTDLRSSAVELLEREDELAALREAAAAGRPRVVVIAGEGGCGKSSLLAACAEAFAGEVLMARCSELERPFAHGVALQLLRHHPSPIADFADEVARLAAAGPLALLVDDAHSADEESLTFLDAVATLPVLLVVTLRPDETEWFPEASLIVRPAPLSVPAVRELAGDLAPAVHGLTGGNPLLVRELLDERPSDVRTAGPEATARRLGVTLSRLGPEATALAHAAAVLGDGADLAHAAGLAALDLDTAATAASALERAGVLARRAEVTFAQPVVRTAIYAQLGPGERGLAHRTAARTIFSSAAAERVAAHLLAAPAAGDAWAVGALELAADEAERRGAPAVAARFLRRALAEPPAEPARAALLTRLGAAEAAAGDPAAEATLARAAAATEPGAPRADVLLARAHALTEAGRREEALTALARARAEVETGAAAPPAAAVPPAGAAPLDDLPFAIEAAWVGVALWDPALAPCAAERAEALLAPASAAQRAALARLVASEVDRGRDRERTLAWALAAWGEPIGEEAAATLARAFLAAGAFDACREVCERGPASTELAVVRGALALAEGRLAEAVADLEPPEGWELRLPEVRALRAHVGEELGEPVALRIAPAVEERLGGTRQWAHVHEARGRLALLADDLEGALPHFRAAGVESGEAVALARLGRRDEAIALLDAEIEELRAWGAPHVLGPALRRRGMIRGRPGVDDLAEAVALLDGSGARLELANALTDHAVALRAARRRSEATEALHRARELAAACGARPLVERIQEQLGPAAARRSGAGSLTPGELRVARMAAAGATNREIAEALFVTRKAVEWHLGNAYRKLGVRSRADLPASL